MVAEEEIAVGQLENDAEILIRQRKSNKNSSDTKLTAEAPKEPKFIKDPKSDITAQADAIFNSLVYEAINIPGDHGIPHREIIDDWASPKLVKEGKDFFNRQYFSCVWAIMVTELVQYPIQRITGFVLRNESYNGPNFAYLRGVVTLMHIWKWFEGDVIDKGSESAQDLFKVRKIHQNALSKLRNVPPSPANTPINKKLDILDSMHADMADVEDPDFLPSIMTSTPSVPMSQFDMVIVHGVFFFLLDNYPKRVGLHDLRGYESYIHYLAIVGKYLGISDRFNMALLEPNVRKCVSKRIWHEIMLPCFKNFNEVEYVNLNYFSENGFLFNPFELIMYVLVRDIMGINPADNTEKHLNFMDGLIYNSLPMVLFLVKYRPVLYLVNVVLKFWYWVGMFCSQGLRKTNKFSGKAGSTATKLTGKTSNCMF